MFLSIFSHHKKIHRIFTAATKSRFLVPSSQGSLEENCRAESTGPTCPQGRCWPQTLGWICGSRWGQASLPRQLQPKLLCPKEKVAGMPSPISWKQHHPLSMQVTAGRSSAKNKEKTGIKHAFHSYCTAGSNGKFLPDLQRNADDRFIFTAVWWRRMISKDKSFWNGQLDSATQESGWI